MQDMICFIKEFEGIIGALLGALLTLIVTELLKQRGKLKFYLMNFKGNYVYFDKVEHLNRNIKNKNCELDHYKIDFVINSSEFPKIMRDIKIVVFKGFKKVEELKATDEKIINRSVSVDEIHMCTIKPKESISFHFSSKLSKDSAKKMNSGLTIKLSYKNEKNKTKYIRLFNGIDKETTN